MMVYIKLIMHYQDLTYENETYESEVFHQTVII